MPQCWKPLEQLWAEGNERAELARTIYREFKEYVLDGQVYVVPKQFYHFLKDPQFNKATKRFDPARYPDMHEGRFYYWLKRLIDEGFMAYDTHPGSRAVRCTHLEIVEKEDAPDI